ncbi:MAG: DNA polymerase III subunit alpha, partial [Rhodobacteraceae bacterium]|nr:DNA polymerase III subunit alpha [Paracoccaceae bacterium]
LGIALRPPCVNGSQPTFAVEDGAILYALGALKGVGVEAMRIITAERAAGPFAGLFDFASRVDLRRVGKKALEMLARAGALDALDSNRRKSFECLEALTAHSAAAHDERGSAQVSLFGETTANLPAPRLPQPEDWAPIDRLAQEHAAVGFYLSGHPLDAYRGPLRRQGVLTHAELLRKAGAASAVTARIAGTVAAVEQRKSARGNRFALVRLSDPTGLYEVRMFADVLDPARDCLEPGRSVVLAVEATLEGDEMKLLARAAQPVDLAVADAAGAGLRIFVNDAAAAPSLAVRLAAAVDLRSRSRGPIHLVLLTPDLPEIEIALAGAYPVSPQVSSALKQVQGVVHIEDF